MQDLTEKNTRLSQELEECKAQLEAALAVPGGATECVRIPSRLCKNRGMRGDQA